MLRIARWGALLLLMLLSSAAAGAQEAVLRVGVAVSEQQEFERELVEGLCLAMARGCEVEVLRVADVLAQFRAGEFDVVALRQKLNKKSAAQTKVLFVEGAKFMVRKKSEFKVSYAGLADKIIGAQSDSVYARFAAEQFKSAQVKTYEDMTQAYADLQAGGIDAVLAGRFAQQRAVKDFETLQLKGTTYRKAKYFRPLRLALSPSNDATLAAFNEAIVKYKKSSAYKKLVASYF